VTGLSKVPQLTCNKKILIEQENMVKSRRQGVLDQKGQRREEINQSYSKDIAKKPRWEDYCS